MLVLSLFVGGCGGHADTATEPPIVAECEPYDGPPGDYLLEKITATVRVDGATMAAAIDGADRSRGNLRFDVGEFGSMTVEFGSPGSRMGMAGQTRASIRTIPDGSEFILGLEQSGLDDGLWLIDLAVLRVEDTFYWLGNCPSHFDDVTRRLTLQPGYQDDPRAAYVRLLGDRDFLAQVRATALPVDQLVDDGPVFLDVETSDSELLDGLVSVPIEITVPGDWMGREGIICTKIDRGWNSCVSLEVFEPGFLSQTMLLFVEPGSPLEVWVKGMRSPDPASGEMIGSIPSKDVERLLAAGSISISIETHRSVAAGADIADVAAAGDASLVVTIP